MAGKWLGWWGKITVLNCYFFRCPLFVFWHLPTTIDFVGCLCIEAQRPRSASFCPVRLVKKIKLGFWLNNQIDAQKALRFLCSYGSVDVTVVVIQAVDIDFDLITIAC